MVQYTKQQYDDVMAGKIMCMTRDEELALGREVARGRVDPDNPPKWAKKAIQDEKLWLAVFGDANSFENCIDYTDHYNVHSPEERAAERKEVIAFLANASISEIEELKSRAEAQVSELLNERKHRKDPNSGPGATASENGFTSKEVCGLKAATNQQLDEEIHDHEWILEQIRNTLAKRGESPLNQLPKETQAQELTTPQNQQQETPQGQTQKQDAKSQDQQPTANGKKKKQNPKASQEQPKAQEAQQQSETASQNQEQPETSQEPGNNEQVVDEEIVQQPAVEAARCVNGNVPPQGGGSESLNDLLAALAEAQTNQEILKSQEDTLGKLESLVNAMKNHNNQMEQQWAQILHQINDDPQVIDAEVITEPERKTIPQQPQVDAAFNYGNNNVPPMGQQSNYGQPGFNAWNFVPDQAAQPAPGMMGIGDINPAPNFTSPVPQQQMVNGAVACGLPVAGQPEPQQPQVAPAQQQPQTPNVWPPIGKEYYGYTPQKKQAYIYQWITDSNGAINDIPDYSNHLNDDGKAEYLRSRISMIPGHGSVLQIQGYGLLALLADAKFKDKMLRYHAIGGPDGAKLVQVPIERYDRSKAKEFDMAFLVQQEKQPNSPKNGAILICFNSFPRYDFKERIWKWKSNIDTCNLRKDEIAFKQQRDAQTVQEQKPSQKPANEALATIGSVLNGIMGNTEYAKKIGQALAGAVQN